MARIYTFSRFEEPTEPEVIIECTCCGRDIYEGEDYIEYDGDSYCDESCLIDDLGVIRKTAGEEY